MATYNKIEFIAFEIKTAPEKDTSSGTKKYKYIGIPCIQQSDGRMFCQQDLDARCQLMMDAILTAQKESKSNSDVLKVFMAPEFFFRGPMGAYEMEDAEKVIKKLQDMVQGKEWEGWMFIFGTIVAASYKTKDYNTGTKIIQVIDPASVKEVYNFALVQMGGYLGEPAYNHCRVVQKEFKSPIDFIKSPDEGLSHSDVKHLDTASDSGIGKEQSQVNYSGLSIFDFSEVVFNGSTLNTALDICLDHSQQRTAKSPLLPGGNMVQIQLIPSCGMTIQPYSLVTQPGGFAFNVDGISTNGRSDLKKVSTYHVLDSIAYSSQSFPVQVTGFSPPQPSVNVTQIFDSATPGTIRIYEQIAPPLPKPVECIFITKGDKKKDGETTIYLKFFYRYDLKGEFEAAFLYILMKGKTKKKLSDIVEIPQGKGSQITYVLNFDSSKYNIKTYYEKGSFGANLDYGIYIDINKEVGMSPQSIMSGFYCPLEGKIDIPSSPPLK